jgi:GNAT superfamily N-acetyltransferase
MVPDAELRWLGGTGDDHWRPFATLLSWYWRDIIPNEQPILVDDLHAEVLHAPAHRRVDSLLATDAGDPVAACQVVVDGLRAESAWLRFLYVAPGHRRQGIGSRLFDAAFQRARSNGRRRLRTMTATGHTTGQRFAERHGGRPGLVIEQSRCPTATLDPRLLQGWISRAPERAGGYSLVAFDGVCPEDLLDAFAAAIPIMNTAPRAPGTEDVAPSPAEVRENMSAHVRQGNEPWTICARDDATGRFVGYTELSFPSRRRWVASQGDTGVDTAHRGRGIGRWLKATNARRVLVERPEVEYIETLNADANEAMLAINRAMGFRPVALWQEWEFCV